MCKDREGNHSDIEDMRSPRDESPSPLLDEPERSVEEVLAEAPTRKRSVRMNAHFMSTTGEPIFELLQVGAALMDDELTIAKLSTRCIYGESTVNIPMPFSKIREVFPMETNAPTFPADGYYATGIIAGKMERLEEAKELMDKLCRDRSIDILAWRTCPTTQNFLPPQRQDNNDVHIMPLLAPSPSFKKSCVFFDEKLAEIERGMDSRSYGGWSLFSLSCKVLVFYGLYCPSQMYHFFVDLQSIALTSIAIEARLTSYVIIKRGEYTNDMTMGRTRYHSRTTVEKLNETAFE